MRDLTLYPRSLRHVMTVGTDLDLTLIDTRKATAIGLAAVNTELGETIDIDEFLSRLGMPIRDELARWIPPERVPAAVDVFRATFLDDGLHHLTPLPGAVDLTRMVEDRGGRLIVITSRIPPIANAILESCGLKAATVIGDATGLQKARPIVDHHVEIYIGDHPLDMEGTLSAAVPGVGVTTGAHAASQLEDAGATWIVDSLTSVVAAISD